MQPYTSTRCCNREWTRTTEKRHAYQARHNPQSTLMEFCPDQIHKLNEDFTLSLGNMTLTISQDYKRREDGVGRARKKRTVTEVKTARGERDLPLTVSLTFWWATGPRDDQ